MKTESTKKEDGLQGRRWLQVDATQMVLGRLASEIANLLRGKHRVTYTPHVDTGDFVIVTNAAKVVLTGKKNATKLYHEHSGHVGGIKTRTAAQLREQDPVKLIEKAVWGMIGNGTLARERYSKLRVFAGPEHPHAAQKPEAISFKQAGVH